MSASTNSTFLDIGAGFGKPVFHSAIQTGCESIGIEIVPARVIFCQDQKYNFVDYYSMQTKPTNNQEKQSCSQKRNQKAQEKQLIALQKSVKQLLQDVPACDAIAKKHTKNLQQLHDDIA